MSVHFALRGPVETDVGGGLEIPKSHAASVAPGILDRVENGQ